MAPFRKLIYVVLVLIFLLPLPFSARIFNDGKRRASSLKKRGYEYGEWVPLFANKVFGADERCVAYSYFSLSFCPPGGAVPRRKKFLNEILAGDCLTNTRYELKFGVSESENFLCEKYMAEDDLKRFKLAIAKKFQYQMYFGNIWFGSTVGEAIEEPGLGQKFYLFNHIEFNVDVVENKVIGINIVNSLDFSVDITNITEALVEFSYSVFWNEIKPTNNSNYFISGNKIAAEKTSWILEKDRRLVLSSIWLWTVIAFWWIAMPLVVASPYLLRYFTKNRQPHGGIRHADDIVCHCPMFTSLLGATLGVGTQHLIIIVLLFVSAYEGIYPCNLERISADLVIAYCLTSVPAAFMARSFHEKFSIIGSKECIFQTGAVYIFPVFLAVILAKIFVMSTLMVDHAVYLISIAGFGSAILMYLCCIALREVYRPEYFTATCDTRKLVGLNVPPTLWYLKTPGQMIFVGLGTFLPMCSLMDDIYASLWGLKVCGSFFTLLVTFLMVIITTIISGVSLTSIQLLKHDYDWWWRSVLRGGSPAVFMFLYGIYFQSKIKMESHREFLPLLVYNVCICYSFFLVLGMVGFRASHFTFTYYMSSFTKKRS